MINNPTRTFGLTSQSHHIATYCKATHYNASHCIAMHHNHIRITVNHKRIGDAIVFCFTLYQMGKGGQNAIGAELDVPNLVCTGSEKDTLHLVDKTTYVSLCQEEESFRNLSFVNRNSLHYTLLLDFFYQFFFHATF